MTPSTTLTPDQTQLLAWYVATFVPEPTRDYAFMNPTGHGGKYTRRIGPLDPAEIGRALAGEQRRLRSPHGQWYGVPISIAITPEHTAGWALAGAIDIDAGSLPALGFALMVCQQHGLWAFAQASESDQHSGGHLYIPVDQPTPASLLHDLAARIQAAAGVTGESYPNNRDLRLPLMPHLRAPGGPTRYPLILPGGQLLDTSDAWAALDELKRAWQPNSPAAITAALATLPALSPVNRQPLHKSHVNPLSSASVISWYNDHYAVEDLLASAGATGRGHVLCCPWHHDRNPSLALWTHRSTGRLVCKCFSQNSGCPAAERPYMDSFNVYCLLEGLDAKAAVKKIADDHSLGQQRTYQTAPAPEPTNPAPNPAAALKTHQAAIDAARVQLAAALEHASDRAGHVTVIKATPGIGKTHQAAELANRLQRTGKTVAIVAQTLDAARLEWTPRLVDPFIWRSRLDICTCYPPSYLADLAAKGGPAPDCFDGCPYPEQHHKRAGHITIYQHNHLVLNGGELLSSADVVIVDESPMGALLEEHVATQHDIRRLANRLDKPSNPDPAVPLLRALWEAGNIAGRHAQSLHSINLRTTLEAVLSLASQPNLSTAIADAKTSAVAKPASAPRQLIPDASVLPTYFFDRLLKVLDHDMAPGASNPLLAWCRHGPGIWRWSWFERHTLLKKLHGKLTSPAVIVLDGSADQAICDQLYAPWPVDLVTIDVPLSPTVQVVQCARTASTRKLVHNSALLDRTIRAVAGVCEQLGIIVDAGISYLAATNTLEQGLGGDWLHYGGQRGRNDLCNARTLAIIASPTAPPDAIERKAMALWSEDMPLDRTWAKIGIGDYHAADPRLEAMNRLHGAEELRQAAHRCRPILSDQPTTLLIFSPWDIAPLGLTPTTTITQIHHGNSAAAHKAYTDYQARRTARTGSAAGAAAHAPPQGAGRGGRPPRKLKPGRCNKMGHYKTGCKIRYLSWRFVIGQNIAMSQQEIVR